jgi:AraC-like DNA-binding protein
MVYASGTGSPRLRMNALGVREWMTPGMYHRPGGTDDYLIVSFHHAASLGVGTEVIAVPPPSLILWRPHSPNLYGREGDSWCHSWLHCEGEDARELLAESGLPYDVPIHGIDPRWLDRCIVAMHDEVRRHARPDPAILRNHLHTFLREAARAAHGAGAAGAPEPLLELRGHLEATFARRHTLRDLARRLGCSIPHLCNRFRRHFGRSPIDYVIELRLRHAAMLLRSRERTVAGVAREVGYEDYHHFSKLFHARFGQWPSELRTG